MIKKESVTYTAFYERFSELDDNRILEILKNQKDYQDSAKNAAVQIAIERGLIHSEEDLLAPEFQSTRSTVRSIFPSISDEYHRNRLTGSISRFLFIFSFLPFVYGAMQYAKGDLMLAALGIVAGALWFLVVLIMKRTKKSILIFPLLTIVLIAAVFVGNTLIKADTVRFVDLLMLVIGVLLPVFFLLYIKKLIDFK